MLLRFFRQSKKPQSLPQWQIEAELEKGRAMNAPRAKLKEHLETIAALKAQIDEYDQHHCAAEQAEAELNGAQAELEALADREAEQYRAYVVGGAKGAPPEPLADLRAEAMQRLDQARSNAEQARERSGAVLPLSDDAHARLTALIQCTNSAACAALLEEASEIAGRMYRSFAEANAAEAALWGIRDSFMARRDGVSANAIDDLIAGGPWPLCHDRRERMRKRAEEIRPRFAKALDQIEADPAASFPLEAVSYPTGKRAA